MVDDAVARLKLMLAPHIRDALYVVEIARALCAGRVCNRARADAAFARPPDKDCVASRGGSGGW